MSRIRFSLNWFVLAPVLILISIGFVMVLSTSPVVGAANYSDSYFFVKKHLIFIFLGILALGLGYLIPHQTYKTYLGLGFSLSLFLLILTFVPGIAVQTGGASRWIRLGGFGFQPVECVKFFIAVFLSVSLENKRSQLNYFHKGLIPIVSVVLIPVLLLSKQPDLGNIGLILIVTFSLFWVSPIPFRYFSLLVATAALGIAISIALNPYQMDRILAFLNPTADPLGKNYHVMQSLTAIGSGGFFGLGIGESKLKYFYLPLQYSDFIFSIICEEGGFFLGATLILLYFFLFMYIVKVASKTDRFYSYYLCLGLGFFIVFQAFLNMMVVTGLFPVTGIPLTFISFGGTSFVTGLFFIGVILNISKQNKDREHDFVLKEKDGASLH